MSPATTKPRPTDIALAVKAKPAALRSGATVEMAFKSIARSCLAHLKANEACALGSRDPEGLHQMRVAVRRLRSGLELFRDLLPKSERKHFTAEFGWLGRQLGHARDWDVFFGRTLEPLMRRRPDVADLNTFVALARRRRRAAHGMAHSTIGAARYRELKRAMAAWTREHWTKSADQDTVARLRRPIDEFAGPLLERRYNRLVKLSAARARLDMSGLHRLRIRAKKLRYAAEFFRALYRAKAAKRQIADLAEIQDCLGVVNDAAIGRALLAEAGGAEHDRAQALIEDWFAAREEDHLSRFDARWRPYAKAAPFWRDNGNLARTDDAA